MQSNYFQVQRGGVHSTFQDTGFKNVQHIGITTGGVIDNHLFQLANKLLDNDLSFPVIEFANQGPLLELKKGMCRFAITGNVAFNIISKNLITQGIPNRTYHLYEGDKLDILTTIKSNYGYFTVEGGFNLQKEYGCFSTLTQSKIGANEGSKICKNQKINFNNNFSESNTKIEMDFKTNNIIRVVRGPQMNYFMLKKIKKFFEKNFYVSKTTNRMGVRLEGNITKAIKPHNIASEGIVKGSIQVPGNGEPIVLMNDHPTIGGYPKIAIVILSDLAKLAQFPIGTNFTFQEVSISEAENIYLENKNSFNLFISKITKI